MLALCIQFQLFAQFGINPSNFKSDQNLISPHSNTTESFREIIKIKKWLPSVEALIVLGILLVRT